MCYSTATWYRELQDSRSIASFLCPFFFFFSQFFKLLFSCALFHQWRSSLLDRPPTNQHRFYEKLNDKNFNTWRPLAWLTVQTLGLEHHLDASKTPQRYVKSSRSKSTTSSKTAKTDSPPTQTPTTISELIQESDEYKEWRQTDLALTTWLVASMTTTFTSKVLHCTRFADAWSTIIDYFTTASKTRVQSLQSQLRSVEKQVSLLII
ncbi:hypothetical protein S245_048991 [Arachis hypogaea]|nr:uncharacterized protein DS421_14g471430 [Arachis hypogaea]